MKVADLITELQKLPKDYDICLSKVMVLDEGNDIVAVLDFPFGGIADNPEDKEVRLCIWSKDVELNKYFGEYII